MGVGAISKTLGEERHAPDLSEFGSGEDYDAQYGDQYEPEIAYLSALVLEQKGAVLDLCCGTGIVTIPLAETGLVVGGVDMAPAMLERASTKAGGRKNPSFYLQDALTFSSYKRFRLVLMTGNAFQAFLSEEHVKALLASVNKHLEPGGMFVFDTRLPEGYDLSPDTDFELWGEYTGASGQLVRWFVKQTRFDAERNILHFEMKRRYPNGSDVCSSTKLKFTPLTTLLSVLEESGFEVVNTYKNWWLEPSQPGGATNMLELKKV